MFKMAFEGKKMSCYNTDSLKVLSVTPAALQGFDANYAHYSSARVNRGDPSARPLFLREPSPELLGKASDPVQGDQEKGSKRRQRKNGKPQAAENTLKTPPKQRLDKKAIDAGNAQYQQYQGSETTTTAQDSQESTESLESQESQ